jgi:hypothetical protein
MPSSHPDRIKTSAGKRFHRRAGMLRRLQTFLAVSALSLGIALLAAAQSPTHPADSLLLQGPGQQVKLSLGALKAMHQVTIKVTNAHEHVQQTYTGVPLVDLLRKVGAPEAAGVRGKALSEYVVATGSDNYKVVLSLAESEPAFHPGTVIVADMLDGKPLDTKQGPLKLVVDEDHEPVRWVHNLVRLELHQIP